MKLHKDQHNIFGKPSARMIAKREAQQGFLARMSSRRGRVISMMTANARHEWNAHRTPAGKPKELDWDKQFAKWCAFWRLPVKA